MITITMATAMHTHIHKLTLCCLVLCACSQPAHWRAESLERAEAQYSAERLLSPAESPFLGCQIEIVQSEAYGQCGYLNRYGLPAVHGQVTLCCTSGAAQLSSQATALEGGQRLRLDPKLVSYLIEALHRGQPITLHCSQGGSLQLNPDPLISKLLPD
jgi:hypothetical protein